MRGSGKLSTTTDTRGAELNAHNTFERPDVVTLKTTEVTGEGPSLRCALPPASVNRLEIKLA